MQIRLTADKKLKDIQKEFSNAFPFLKIEFFQDKHQKGEGSLFSKKLNSSFALEQVTDILKAGSVPFCQPKLLQNWNKPFRTNSDFLFRYSETAMAYGWRQLKQTI